jgi:hypothetical protein
MTAPLAAWTARFPDRRQPPGFLATVLALAMPWCTAPMQAGPIPLSSMAPTPASAPAGSPASAPARTPAPATATAPAQVAPTLLRRQQVEPLPGGLDDGLLVNDNNPELISAEGILFSGFDPRSGWTGRPLAVASAHLNQPLSGNFELFSHHVFAGRPESLDSTLWLAVVAAPRDHRAAAPVALRLRSGATSLSQATVEGQSAAPFLPLPPLLVQQSTQPVWSGPGSRVATELLERGRSTELPSAWTLRPGQLTPLLVLPLPVRGLDPLLNGRNLQLRLASSAPVDLAVLAAFGPNGAPPDPAVWARILEADLSPKEHAPSPRGASGPMIYSRVSGVQLGSTWRGRIGEADGGPLRASRAPISWPIASLLKGSLGTAQVQTAELRTFYPGTAWAAHGNYGVTYDLSLPLRNDSAGPLKLQLALESPLKHDQPLGGLRFRQTPSLAVVFRGSVEVAGLDGPDGQPLGRQVFHLVQRAGQQGPALGSVSLAPGQQRRLQVRLIYPADATPPQVLSLLPWVDPSRGDEPPAAPAAARPRPAGAAGAAVKQSPLQPATAP